MTEPYFSSVTAVHLRLYVLTVDGSIRRVTHLGIRPSGQTVPITINSGSGFTYITDVVRLDNWLSCHIARLRGAHIPKPEPEHSDFTDTNVDDATAMTATPGELPAATAPLSIVPNHRRPKTTGKNT